MSLLFDGTIVSFTFSPIPTTLISPALASRFPVRRSTHLFTVTAGPYGPFSFTLACTTSATLGCDMTLGLDWSSHLRECLLGLGLRVPSNFDCWGFFESCLPSLLRFFGQLTALPRRPRLRFCSPYWYLSYRSYSIVELISLFSFLGLSCWLLFVHRLILLQAPRPIPLATPQVLFTPIPAFLGSSAVRSAPFFTLQSSTSYQMSVQFGMLPSLPPYRLY
jgi:hypothetical protein